MRTGYGSQNLSQFVRNGDMRNITLNGRLAVNGASGVSVTTGSFTNLAATNLAATNIATAGNFAVGGNITAGEISLQQAALSVLHYDQPLSSCLVLYAAPTVKSEPRQTVPR